MTGIDLASIDLDKLTPEMRAELQALVAADKARVLWRPLPGPQLQAYESAADVVGFGGAAGGGKTALGVGLSLTAHRRVGIFRQHGTELGAILDYMAELLGGRDGYNGRENIWRTTRRDGVPMQIEFASFPNVGDEVKQQGRARDLLVFDEAQNMREAAVRYVMTWLRTTTPGQRCRALFTFNPPTTAEGRWVVDYFAPWLDRKHPRPAKPGELRWFATVDGKDREVESGDPFEHAGELITPRSRTFIASRITDNPFLLSTGYMAQLQSLPEPLRSQMLHGDFEAGMEDDPWQVVPTAWVEASMARWVAGQGRAVPMDSLGVDVARGGRDSTILARRHGNWFDAPLVYPGSATPSGPAVAGLVIAALRDHAPIHVDVIGVGASPFDFLRESLQGQRVVGVNVAEAPTALDKSGKLQFRNLRSQLWWQMREALDPEGKVEIALPPDRRLLADLTAPTWKLLGSTIAVASRDEIHKRIGRSPDFGSAYVLALMGARRRTTRAAAAASDDPFDRYREQLRRRQAAERGEPDPYAVL